MNRTRFLTVAIAILALWGVMQAQSPTSLVQDTSLSFQQILALAQPMLDSMRAQNGGIPTHDEKVFSRWREFWGKHIDYLGSKSGGDFKAAMNYHRMLAQGNMSICDQGVGTGSWSLVGPIRDEVVNNVKTMHMGIVNAVATHPSNPSIIYAGCNFSGVWRTVDAGLNWQCVTDPLRLPLLPVHGLAIDPVDPQIIFAGTGETSHNGVSFGLGIFRSTDSGSSWALCQGFNTIYDPTDPTRGEVNVIRFHPNYANNGIMLAAGRREIYQSLNRGVSWSLVMQIPFTGVLGSWDSFFDL